MIRNTWKYFLFAGLFFLCSHRIFGQVLRGKVFELPGKDTLFLSDAQVVLSESRQYAVTDSAGFFLIPMLRFPDTLYVQAFGYQRGKFVIHQEADFLFLVLKKEKMLNEVEVVSEKSAQEYSVLQPLQVQNLNEQYLRKAACCNLSESFETNASIDVQLTDAITGIRQIQMNGLTGKYILLTRENMPYLFGIQNAHGLSFLPGPFIESIQLAKGTGPVMNGNESFSGQINAELWHPDRTDFKMYFNSYFNQNARNEYNLVLNQKNEHSIASNLLLHTSINPLAQDMNHDGYVDIPTGNQWNMAYKGYIQNEQGLEWIFGIHSVNDEKKSGQIQSNHRYSETPYIVTLETRRTDVFSKSGWIFRKKPGHSVGLQLLFSSYENLNTYGKHVYEGHQKVLYSNLIYQGIIRTTVHTYKAGITFYRTDAQEQFRKIFFSRNEILCGTFAEYNYIPSPVLSVLLGTRADYHSYYGWIVVPRFHLKWNINNQKSTFKISAGRAFRTPNPLAENTGFMASSREFYFYNQNKDYPYGLLPEDAWTLGVNFYHSFRLFYRPASLLMEYYYTHFISQSLADGDTPGRIFFYSTHFAYAQTIQTEFKVQPLKRMECHFSVRHMKQRSKFLYGINPQPFIPDLRGFINVVYTTRNKKWNMDFTAQYTSSKRLPNTFMNPVEYQRPSYSFPYWNLLSQISYIMKKNKTEWHFYVGIENLNNFRLRDPILAAHTPSSPYFDASMIWASVYGRMGYAGIRLYIR